MKALLYPYQTALASQVLNEFDAGRSNVVLAAACGAGKTITSIAICEQLLKRDPALRILVLTHGQVVLRTQFVDDIIEQKPDFSYTVVKSCRDLNTEVHVYVGLPHTVRRCAQRKFDVIIVDEAHHFYFCRDGMVQSIIKNSQPRFTLFLTGSPSKFIKQQYTLYSISLLELYERGRVCSPVVELAQSSYDYTVADYNNHDELKPHVKFSPEQTKETLDGLLTQVLRVLKSDHRAVPEARDTQVEITWEDAARLLDKTMFVCRSQQQASQVRTYFEGKGVDVALSTSRFDEHSKEMERFKKEENCKVLVVVNRGTLGFNMPTLVNIVDLSGSRNVDVLFQMFARLVRRHPDDMDKLFLKVVPEAMAEYVYVLMSFVIALSHEKFYQTYDGDVTQTRIPVCEDYLKRVQDNGGRQQNIRPRPLKVDELPPVPCIEVMQSLFHENGELLSSYAFTTLEEVRKRLSPAFLPFEDARDYAQSLKLASIREWNEWRNSGARPDNIPSDPSSAYKDQWQGVGDWLGTGNTHKGLFLSFEKARDYVRSLKLNNRPEWENWYKSGARPKSIPSAPRLVYKDQWTNWGDWLGTGITRKKAFRLFEDARDYTRSLKLENKRAWNTWRTSGARPKDIPACPPSAYKDQWKGWGDWLGRTRVVANGRDGRISWVEIQEGRLGEVS